jgi:hypothetical protein
VPAEFAMAHRSARRLLHRDRFRLRNDRRGCGNQQEDAEEWPVPISHSGAF